MIKKLFCHLSEELLLVVPWKSFTFLTSRIQYIYKKEKKKFFTLKFKPILRQVLYISIKSSTIATNLSLPVQWNNFSFLLKNDPKDVYETKRKNVCIRHIKKEKKTIRVTKDNTTLNLNFSRDFA